MLHTAWESRSIVAVECCRHILWSISEDRNLKKFHTSEKFNLSWPCVKSSQITFFALFELKLIDLSDFNPLYGPAAVRRVF